MNFKKIKFQIKKIDKLCKVIESSNESISQIEKDLLLSYVRALYEEVIELSPQKAAKQRQKVVSPEVIVFEEPKEDPKAKETPIEVRVINVPPVADFNSELASDENKLKEEPQGEKKEIESSTPIIEEDVTMNTAAGSEIFELFQIKEAKELSEKLSQLPIKNLKSAIGINEKIFTINELFGGNNTVFNEAIEHIDKMDSFEQARDYLVADIATANDWASPLRKKKAQNLIKLIKRRFS